MMAKRKANVKAGDNRGHGAASGSTSGSGNGGLSSLREITVNSAPLQVDENAGVIKGVKVIGFDSRNGRTYSKKALREAVSLYEGKPVYINHNQDPKSDRLAEDKFGWLSSVREAEGGLFADMFYLKSHPMSERVVEAAKRNPSLFGLSQDAQGHVVREGERLVVDSVKIVHSVDLVAQPATVNSLFESLGQGMGGGDDGYGNAYAKKAGLSYEGVGGNGVGASGGMSGAASAGGSDGGEDESGSGMPGANGAAMEKVEDPATMAAKAGFRQAIIAVLDSEADPSAIIAQLEEILNARKNSLALLQSASPKPEMEDGEGEDEMDGEDGGDGEGSQGGASGGTGGQGAGENPFVKKSSDSSNTNNGQGETNASGEKKTKPKPEEEAMAEATKIAELEGKLKDAETKLTEAVSKIKAMEEEAKAAELLESAGVKRDPVKIKAVVALSDEKERQALVESWKPKADDDASGAGGSASGSSLLERFSGAVGVARPKPKSTNLREAFTGYGDASVGGYESAVKGGFASAVR